MKNKLIFLFSFLIIVFLTIIFSARASTAADGAPSSASGGGSFSNILNTTSGVDTSGSSDTVSDWCKMYPNDAACAKATTGPLNTTGDATGVPGQTADPATGVPGQTTNPTSTGIYWPVGTGLPENNIQTILKNVLSWMLGIFGLLALISFVVCGIQYFMVAGDEGQVETAKKNMTYSIIGVIVALSGFIIIQAIDIALRGTGSLF